MRLQKINQNQVRASFTSADLSERNITIDDLYSNDKKIKTIVNDILEGAYELFNIDLSGPILVGVVTTIYGVDIDVVKVSNNGSSSICTCDMCDYDIDDDFDYFDDFDEDEDEDEDILDEEDEGENDVCYASLVFKFTDIEHVISVANSLKQAGVKEKSRLFYYNNMYFLVLDNLDLNDDNALNIESIVAEYGSWSKTTTAVLEEYGKVICKENAIEVLCNSFS